VRDETLLALIRDDPEIAALLVKFDFDIARVADGPAEPVHLAGGVPLTMIAGDAAGGAFLLAGTDGEQWPVVYAGSEGEGGLIATRLRDALALVVGLSSLHDALAMPLGDDGGARLRASLAQADDEIREDWPDLDDDRARLTAALELPPADGLLDALHTAAADEDYRPVSDRGDTYESMLS
jgi:hypothetical protein